jgi:tRNA (guanine-N7-)-methyltransferase
MPNVVLKTDKKISELSNIDFFYGRGIYLYPVKLDTESFFLRIYENKGGVTVKLEKATMPKITSNLKQFMLQFSKNLAEALSGEIIHHNLNATKNTDYKLFDKYELKTNAINSVDWINDLCTKDKVNLEIGMGSGEFLTDMAARYKDECFLGVEVLNSDFYVALRRFALSGLDNTRAIFYDARAVFDKIKPNSLKNVYLNFPEPWYKKKKLKHSILTKKTAKQIENILGIGSKFSIITDNHPFAVSSSVILESSTGLLSINRHPIIITNENIKTKYEKKWIKYKRTIYRLDYKKVKSDNARKVSSIKFPLQLNLKNTISDKYVFKVLGLYENNKKEKIIELTLGSSINPQHGYFAFYSNQYVDILPQSNFIANEDFINALKLAQ